MDNITKDLLTLNSIPGFGYKKLQILLGKFGNTANIVKNWDRYNFLGKPASEKIVPVHNFSNIEEEIELINKQKIDIVTIFDKKYPDNLKQIHSPPIVLYVKGQLECIAGNTAPNEESSGRSSSGSRRTSTRESSFGIAVVGSRNCTYYGKSMARRICSSLAKLNITVVSGMARGIDTAAHKETLAAGGKTVAVLGSGLNRIYPSENRKLSGEIAQNGALISEFPMNTPPLKENFPRRNRIISGLSKGVVVVEAPERSGALITADFALEQGKEVFAIPGAANSDNSKGCNNLIKQGAKLTCDAFDIIAELFPEILARHPLEKQQDSQKQTALLNIGTEQRKVYGLLSDEPISIESLIDMLKLTSQEVSSRLLHLELAGLVKQLPGKLYVRKWKK